MSLKNIIPWRLRNFVSDHFPLAYHLIVNLGLKGNDPAFWDDRLANNWDATEWPHKVELLSALLAPEQQILDIACGTGSILRGLRRNGFKNLHGFDNSNYACNRLTEEGFAMRRGKLPALPFEAETFDAIIASQVLEHVIRRKKFAQEIARVLKPHGKAYIFVPNDSLGPIDEPSHVMKYNAKTLSAFLATYFDVLSVEVVKEPQYANTVLFAHVATRAGDG